MVRDSVQLETVVNTISHEYLLDFTSEYGIPEMLHPELPGPGDMIVDFPEGKGGCPLAKGRGRILPNVTPSHWILSRIGKIASFVSTRECFRPSWTGGRMPPKTGCQLRAHMDLFSLIRAPNPTKVKVRSRPRAPHEVPLLTLTANHAIEMDDPATATDSSGVPPTIERSPLDFSLEAGASDQGTAASEVPPSGDVPAATAPEPSQVGVAAADPSAELLWGKEPAAIQLGLSSTASMPEDAPTCVSDPDPLCFADPPARPLADVARSSPGITAAGDPKSENASSPAEVGSPRGVYRPELGVTNGSLLDTPEACQDLVDHVAPPGYFFELRHMHNEDFLGQYNVNLARQVAIGSQLRLRFEQKAKLLKKSVARVARRDKRIQARELEIKNLEALLETEADMKKAAEDKSAGLIKELEDMRARFSDLQCGESLDMRQAFADVVSAGITKGLSEGLRHGVEHGQTQRNVESIEAYDPEAEAKFVAALQSLKDLKYPLLDQLEGLKDAPIDVIMAALYLESDTGEDTPQCIRDLRPSSSQLTIPVYPKKKKCRIVFHTHGVGSAHHARSDGIPVSAPMVVPQGLAMLLADAATQTEFEER
nr:putative transposase (putative), gypsy type [Tanacetum cinerariifolium]